MRRTRWILLAVVLVLIAVVLTLLRQDPGGSAIPAAQAPAAGSVAGETRGPAAAPTVLTPPGARRDAAGSGAAAIERARDVLAAVEARGGEPLSGYVGGRTFHNRERRLPAGRYREYDVHPRVPGQSRGPERLLVDQTTGRAYYTGDHYRTFVPLN
jgi:ribonuclease T1